ncbi:MAG: RHS repeat protein [Xanthomonadales bacterium]|nr:RHS repeat protein [Xanthomonadales bacterium]
MCLMIVANIAATSARAAFDANGNATSERRFGQPPISRSYDALDRVISESVNTRVSKTEYDAAGRVTKTIDPLNRQTLSGYDAAGRRTTSTDPWARPRPTPTTRSID